MNYIKKEIEKEKKSKVTVARQAASCIEMHAQFYSSNSQPRKKANKILAVTKNTDDFKNCQKVVNSNYGEETSRFHIIDLDKYEYDKSVIVYTRCNKYTKVKNPDMKLFLQNSIKTNSYEIINNIQFDDLTLKAFEQMTSTETETFFEFYQKHTQHIVRITLIKNGKVIENLCINVGYLTVIHTLRHCEIKTIKGREKMADRLSYNHPVIKPEAAENIEAICVFNEADPTNRMLIDMLYI
ncbi:hypothetical protein [Pseudomonas putida]|uniref:hypothetical protein n=1 Tax=Pseudomonas putida TaxID=303 RepID=UPI000A56D441|nr:hypothetical protein [Pseudomonas putida]